MNNIVDISIHYNQKSIDHLPELFRESECHLVVTTFLSDNLGTSQLLESSILEIAQEYIHQDIHFYHIPADQHQHYLYRKFGVKDLPATLIMKNGEPVDYFSGLVSKSKIRNKLGAHLS